MTSTLPKMIERHDNYMTLNYPRYEIAVAEGRGATFTDHEGKQYIDLFSGFGAGILGHCHPDLVAAGAKQMNKIWHVGNLLHTAPQTKLAKQIADKGFGGRSYFCFSGSDANEAAFKICRLHGQGKRHKIISTTKSFHGRGFAAMMATGQDKVRKGFEPWLEGFINVPFNDLTAMEAAIDEETVGIIVEPIQGEGGVNIPDDDYLPGLRKLADQHDLLLIFDEVWIGCGRTGKYFAYQHWNVEPDMLTLGKAIGCGLPVGVMCANEKAAKYFDFTEMQGVMHATTLGGNAVSMAVSNRLFEVLEADDLVQRAAELGEKIMNRFKALQENCQCITSVRGKGLFIGIELNPEAECASFKNGAELVNQCLDQGVLINATQGNVLRLAPPLVIEEDQLEQGLKILEDLIKG